MTRTPWTSPQREGARSFLSIVSPHHPAILVTNIEDLMPANFREAFEALFVKVEPQVTITASAPQPLDLVVR